MRIPTVEPSELTVLHIGGYWRGANDMVRQMMLGLSQSGARVVEFNTDDHRDALEPAGERYDRGTSAPVWLRAEKLDPVIRRERPDLIVCNAGGLAFRPEVAARLRDDNALLGIALSDPEVYEPTTRHIASTFDLFLTIAPDYVARYRALGAECRALPVGTNPDYYRPVPAVPEHECDVFIACRALPDRIELVKRLDREFRVHLYGEGWERHGLRSRGVIYGDDALRALASAKVSPVFLRTPSGHVLPKVGLFDFTAAGALVVADRLKIVEPYFEYDREILGFEDQEELVAGIHEVLDHPEKAEAIRRAGHSRTLRDHTWGRVWRRIFHWLAEP